MLQNKCVPLVPFSAISIASMSSSAFVIRAAVAYDDVFGMGATHPSVDSLYKRPTPAHAKEFDLYRSSSAFWLWRIVMLLITACISSISSAVALTTSSLVAIATAGACPYWTFTCTTWKTAVNRHCALAGVYNAIICGTNALYMCWHIWMISRKEI